MSNYWQNRWEEWEKEKKAEQEKRQKDERVAAQNVGGQITVPKQDAAIELPPITTGYDPVNVKAKGQPAKVSPSQTATKTRSVQRNIETVRQELAAANAEIEEYLSSFKNPGVLRALATPVQDGVADSPVIAETQSDAKKLAELQKKRDALLAEYDRMTGGDDRTWFQKGAFEDGYQRGDVAKAVLGTKTDAQINLSAGALGLGEKAVDAAAAVAPYNLYSEIQGNYSDPAAQAGATIGQMLASLFMGKDANYVQDQRNALAAQALAEAKPAAEEFIKKDLYDEKKAAEWIVNNATIDGQINKLLGVDAQRDSVLGEKTDAIVQSAGQLAAQYGLTLVGVPWFVTSSVSSLGSEVEGALQQGATLEGAVISGAISAGAEILTEKLFGGDLFVKNAGSDVLVDSLTKGIANKFVQKAARFGLETAGEGAEEWISQRIGQFGQWLGYRHDERELLELLYSEKSLDEAMEAFLGGVALGGGMGVIKATANTQQAQGGSVADGNAQVGNGQVAQETTVKAEPGTLEWVQGIVELGKGNKFTDVDATSTATKVGKDTAQSRRLTDEDIGDYMRVGERRHVRDTKQRIIDNGESPILTKPEEIVNFIRNAFQRKIQKVVKGYGRVNNRLSSAVKSATNGSVVIDDYYLELDADKIAHISDHVGQDKDIRNIPLTEEQLEKLPEYIDTYDDLIDIIQRKDGSVRLMLGKKINGHSIIVETVSKGRKSLHPVTAYQIDSVDYVKHYKTRAIDRSSTSRSANTDTVDISRPAIALNNSISQTAPGVNTNSGKTTDAENTADNTAVTNPTESVGAAPANPSVGAADQNFTGRASYQDLLSDENSQRDRPGDVRPMEVPKADGYGRNVSEFVGNAYGSEVVPDNFTATIEELVQEGALGYDTKTNAESLHEAAEVIKKKGMASARNAITKNIASGKIGDTDIATAMLLFNQYAHKNGQQAQDSAAELFVDLQMMATQTGRDLQLFKMLRKMTPQGQLMAVTKNVDRYVQNVNKRRGRKNQVEVSVPTELTNEYMEAAQDAAVNDTPENQQRKLDAEQAIYEYAAANVPATLQEKWDAWRYMAMLGNPKTQIRNVLGNGLFRPFVEAKRYLGTAMESVFLEQDQRTKSVLGFSESDRALLNWARQDSRTADTMQRMEYTATTGDAAVSEIGDRRQIFNTTALENARTGLNDIMSAEDMWFKRGAYSTALASFLKARGVTAQQLQSGSVDSATLNAARNYAVKEAMKATFNDQNAVSNFVANTMRYKGNNAFLKCANALAEGILPFRRTPANIALRGLEYSPLGLGKTLLADTGKLRNGEITAAEYIDNIAAGLTGSAAMVLGYALASGIFEGIRLVGDEDDEDEKRTGHKSYALEVGNVSIPIDWAAPAVLPLFMGANLYDSLNPENENVSTSVFTGILDACANTLEPMLELSCLSSLNDLITDARYAQQGRELYAIAASAATSYFMQGLPTLFGQVEQAFETEKKSIYADSSDPVIGEVQQVLGRATQKIPGIDLYQTEKVDAWGRTEEKGAAERIFDAFINPANDSRIVETNADSEIKRLNRVQDKNTSPDTPSKTITFKGTDGKTYTDRRLTGVEYEELSKLQGQTQKQIVEDIIANSYYDQLSDEDKAKAIRYAYDYARDLARGEVAEAHPGITTKWMQNIGADPAEGIIRHIAADDNYTSLSVSDASYVDKLLADLLPEKGKTNVRTIQQVEAVAGSKLSEKDQKSVLEDTLDDKAYAKYLRILALGMDTDDYAESYRLYLDAESGKGKKARIIAQFQDKLDVSEGVAKKLYDIYAGAK